MPTIRLLLALLLIAPSVAAQSIAWLRLDPMAVRTGRTEPVKLDFETTGSFASLRLDYAAGGSLALSNGGSGRWSAVIPAAKVLDGYDAADVNHNLVGYLRFLGSNGETLASFNLIIHVLDGNVPAPAIRDLGNGARATPRILNVHRAGIGVSDRVTAARQFYAYARDEFDFLQIVFSTPILPANRFHYVVRNDVSGIGLDLFDSSAAYGSAGRLQGLTVFPIDTYFDTAEIAFSHELAHQWIQYLADPRLQTGSPHWPPSTMARGIMGAKLVGSVGGEFPYEITPLTDTTARVRSSSSIAEFTDLDLYLMGFLPASEVNPGIVIQGSPCRDCVLPSTRITIGDIVAANGPRVPDATTAQKSFRIGTLVVSRDRLLTDDEMAVLEYFATRGEATVPLPFTSGLASGVTNPFYVATRGIGRVDFRLNLEQPVPPRRRAVGR